MFEIRLPATSANLGPGFDSLGLALQLYNTFYFKQIEDDIKIRLLDESGNTINLSPEDNLVYQTMKGLFTDYGKPCTGFELTGKIGIPIGRGLGSSATAIIAGLVAANRYLGNPLTEESLIKKAIAIEGHPDNIVSAFYGGFNINVLTDKGVISKKIKLDETMQIVLVIPDFQLSTRELRQILPEKVSYRDAVFNHSRTALLTACFYEHNLDLLSTAMEDRLHQDYRAPLIPGFQEIINRAYQTGAKGIALSGAGPTIIAICRKKAEVIGQVMVDVFKSHQIDSRYLITVPDNRGIMIIDKEE
jgi:homoserine kinase